MVQIDDGFVTNVDDSSYKLKSGAAGVSLLGDRVNKLNKDLLQSDTSNMEALQSGPEYVYNQSTEITDSELIIGPLRYTYSVQSINLQEQKAVGAVESSRSNKQVLVDSGQARYAATVQLLFPDLDSINLGLRSLITLFRVSPIITVKNELLTKVWVSDFIDKKLRIEQSVEFKQKISDLLDFFNPPTTDGITPATTSNRIDQSNRSSIETARSFSDWFAKTNKNRIGPIRESIVSLKSALNYGVDYIAKPIINRGISVVRDAILPNIISFNNRKTSSEYIPVCLENLSIQTIPDIPKALIATLTFNLIDVSSATFGGELEYLGKEPNSHTILPTQAFWLKRWMTAALDPDAGIVPVLEDSDFDNLTFRWFGIAQSSGIMEDGPAVKELILNKDSKSRLVAASASVRNHFAYQRMVGKSMPCAQHIGSSGRSLSLEIDAIDKAAGGDDLLERLHLLKAKSDQLIRTPSRVLRLLGWEVLSPVTKLLGVSFRPGSGKIVAAATSSGVYVALNCNTETTKEPYRRKVSMDMLENNIEFFRESEVVLYKGGTDFNEFRDWFIGKKGDPLSGVVPGEIEFRRKPVQERLADARNVTAASDNRSARQMVIFESYKLFWPVDSDYNRRGSESLFAALNRDSLIATILNPQFDKNRDLQRALEETILGRTDGLAENGNRSKNFISEWIEGFERAGITTPDSSDLRSGRLGKVLRENVFPRMFTNTLTQDQQVRWADLIIGALFGRPSYASALIVELANPKDGTEPMEFSDSFISALFDTLVERRRPAQKTSRAFSTEGLHKGFFVLYAEFILSGEMYPSVKQSRQNRSTIRSFAQNSSFRRSTYPDIPLPTYHELFGDDWVRFAPTYDDVGQVNWNISQVSGNGPLAQFRTAQLMPSVAPDDVVPPHIWFFSRRTKDLLRDEAAKSAAGILPMARTLAIPLSFGLKEYDIIRNINPNVAQEILNAPEINIEKNRFKLDNTSLSPKAKAALQTLEGIITQGILNKLNSPSAAEVDYYGLSNLQQSARNYTSNPQFAKTFFGEDATAPLALYFSNANQQNAIYQLSADVRGAALLRVIGSEIFTLRKDIGDGHMIMEEASATAGKTRDDIFRRNLESETKRTIDSMIDQIPDQIYSPAKLWPTLKLYLIEQRGNDIIADDAFFDVSTILSVDITDDKDDASLAVIKIADPLYKLQEDTFPISNKVSLSMADRNSNDPKYQAGSAPSNKTMILGNSTERDADIMLKRYKIAQGRSIQIRMGYDSLSENLHVVFTGRITEIEPGDVLTLVAQGWKAELINRQVNFYANKGKNLSVKDIVVQTIQLANPYGIGESFNRRDTNFLLDNIDKLPNQALVRHALAVGRDTSSPLGIRTIGQNVLYPIVAAYDEIANTSYSAGPDDVGLDTRLKNVWVPDINESMLNPGFFRRFVETTPGFQTNYWVVPLQPAWDVLKEASRHAWNCIVQVVPFDGQATLFFGHPDQPYYFTRGDIYTGARWAEYAKSLAQRARTNLDRDILGEFVSSKFYRNQENDLIRQELQTLDPGNIRIDNKDLLVEEVILFPNLFNTRGFAAALDSNIPAYKATRLVPEFYAIAGLLSKMDNTNTIKDMVVNSPLPGEKLKELIKIFPDAIYDIILSGFFGIDSSLVIERWGSYKSDLYITIASRETGSDEADVKFRELALINTPISDITGRVKLNTYGASGLMALSELVMDYIQVPKSTTLSGLMSPEINKKRNEYKDKRAIFLTRFPDYKSFLSEGIKSHPTLHKMIATTLTDAADAAINDNSVLGRIPKSDEGRILSIMESIIRDLREAERAFNSDAMTAAKLERTQLGVGFPDVSTVQTVGEMLSKYRPLLKAFVHFFAEFVASNGTIAEKTKGIGTELALSSRSPIMKTFRQYHYIDSDHDIIANNIVASTSQMWNTVVINRPDTDPVDLKYTTEKDFYKGARISPTVSWTYWPSSEVSQVVGLQFHPGLGLANKKVKVCTELNAVSEPVSAKLACVNLAEGMRRMYRGHLIVRGRFIKPHDRILLQDNYNGMVGPLEVESVTHHWSVETGWVTNIIPQAVCDANPGAAAMQTAVMEAAFRKAYQLVDFIFYASMIFGGIGVAASIGSKAAGFFIKKGAGAAAKNMIANSVAATAAGTAGQQAKTSALSSLMSLSRQLVVNSWTRIRRDGLKGSLQSAITAATDSIGGRFGASLLNSYGYALSAESLIHAVSVGAFTSAWTTVGSSAKQLPVILSPLYYNGAVWTAGMEADEILFAIPFYDTYYSLRSMQEGILALSNGAIQMYSNFGELPR